MKESKNACRKILDRIPSGIFFINEDRIITYWNTGAERITGYTAKEVVGRKCSDFLAHMDESGKLLCEDGCPMLDAFKDSEPQQADAYLQHKMGQRVLVNLQGIVLDNDEVNLKTVVQIFQDISTLRMAQARIHELTDEAHTDKVTGIYNRRGLDLILEDWLKDFKQYGDPFGLIFIDVDHFKEYNDRYGHLIGDQILNRLCTNLKQGLRDTDIIARWGGDEFIILLRDVSKSSIERVTEKIKQIINYQDYRTEAGVMQVTCSLGGAVPSLADDVASLVNRADAAMYHEKKYYKDK